MFCVVDILFGTDSFVHDSTVLVCLLYGSVKFPDCVSVKFPAWQVAQECISKYFSLMFHSKLLCKHLYGKVCSFYLQLSVGLMVLTNCLVKNKVNSLIKNLMGRSTNFWVLCASISFQCRSTCSAPNFLAGQKFDYNNAFGGLNPIWKQRSLINWCTIVNTWAADAENCSSKIR